MARRRFSLKQIVLFFAFLLFTLHGRKNKFVRLFFGIIYGGQICLRFYMTFSADQSIEKMYFNVYFPDKNKKSKYCNDDLICPIATKVQEWVLIALGVYNFKSTSYLHLLFRLSLEKSFKITLCTVPFFLLSFLDFIQFWS